MAEKKYPGSTSSYTHTQITNIYRATRGEKEEPTRKHRQSTTKDIYSTTKDIKIEPNKAERRGRVTL